VASGAAPRGAARRVEDNLRTLGVEQMTLVNLRLLDREPGAADTPALGEMLGALEDLRQEGKLAHIGLSNVSRAQVEEALDLVPVAAVQNQYSVLDRSNEDVLAVCQRGLAFVPFFPLGSAFTGGPKRLAEDPAIARIATKHGATPSQVALAWLLDRDERILLIPGTSSVDHLEENLGAIDVELDADDMDALEAVTPSSNPLETVQN
jgi:pyridoxine 4-dehydrogenase